MQASPARRQQWGGRPSRDPNAPRGGLRRAVGYLLQQRGSAAAAYGALVLATLAQLAVPQLVQNMIDAITQGVTAADRTSGEGQSGRIHPHHSADATERRTRRAAASIVRDD